MHFKLKYFFLKHIQLIILLLVFVCFIIINFNVPKPLPTWEHCADCNDYKVQTVHKLFSKDFLYPDNKFYSPRPFTVPLFYKPFYGNDYAIVDMQKWVLCFSALFLIIAFLSVLTSFYARMATIFIIFFYLTWWPIAGWVNSHISESISLSLMLVWFGAMILYLKKQTWLFLILNLIIVFFFSFTRDSWPYSLLAAYGFMLIYFILIKKRSKIQAIVAMLFIVFIFFFQNFTALEGKRYRLPLFNSLTGRISQNDEYLAWFTKQGMPQANQLQKDFALLDTEEPAGKNFLFSRYDDTLYKPLFHWIENGGKSTYTKFLLTHPAYTFLMHERESHLNKIFSQNLDFYIGQPKGFFTNAYNFFSFFKYWLALILSALSVFVFIKSKKMKLLIAPFIIFFGVINIIVIYNADAMETERHMVFIPVIFNLSSLVALLMLSDHFILTKIKFKKPSI